MIVRMSGMGAVNPLDPANFPPVNAGETFDQYWVRVSSHAGRIPLGFDAKVRTFYEANRPRAATTTTVVRVPSLATALRRAAGVPAVAPLGPKPYSILSDPSSPWSSPQPSSGVMPTTSPAQTAEAAYQQIVASVTQQAPASVATGSGEMTITNAGGGAATPALISQTAENAAFVASVEAAGRRRMYWGAGIAAAVVGGYLLFGRRQAA